MMRGSVSLQRNESRWAFLGVGLNYCSELVGGDEPLTIRWSGRLFENETHYKLGNARETLQECSLVFEGSVYRMNLSFLAGYELEYQLDLSGKVVFKTRTAEISTLIEVPGNKRLLSIDGMSFEHKDYQSKMHFECPRRAFFSSCFCCQFTLQSSASESEWLTSCQTF